ncbi:K Homology domain type 1 [Arabidopsis thaliana x Arabidopsis arenosa]|uniref:K Homology domain type 1 n=1 Tax=Arabidopsis thaliana x Arabidopsis arenosa TaxID=1240361 RepID=A0A8T1Z182_9BRAS|nr:K Homology domain type 1 [Arabidopsis thaliana x Arabidopsis arenosa]
MAEEEVVVISTPPVDLKRKLDEQHAGSNGDIVDDSNPVSDSSQAKRAKLDDEAQDGLDHGNTQENGSSMEVKEEEQLQEPKDENQDSVPLVEEVQDPIHANESENNTCDVAHAADDHVPEDNQQSCIENSNVEECKDVNGGEPQKEVGDESKEFNDGSFQNEDKEVDGENSQKEVDDTQSTTRTIDVPSSKVGVLIGKGGETIRYLQFNSGAKIQILRDSEADPNSALRPVEIIGTVACIENAEKLISAVIAEAEAGGSPALVARGHPSTHAIGIPEQIEIKVPNDKVGLIIGRGGETIKNMQTRSGARIQLIPQHAEGDGLKERTVRISGDKMQIDIATDMIKDVMNQVNLQNVMCRVFRYYRSHGVSVASLVFSRLMSTEEGIWHCYSGLQNARPSPYSGGYNQPAYRPRGPGGPPQWGSRGPHAPHPYDYHPRGPYSSQGSHYNSPGYGSYPPQHMPPRGGYGPGWDQRPPYSGPYDYYGRQGAQSSGPVPPPSGHVPSPALGGPPPSQVSYGYGQSHGPEYGNAAPYSQTGYQQTYGQTYEQPKYDNNPPMQPPYGGSYPPAGGGQPGYSQMQQPGVRPYGMQQGPVQQGYGPPRPAASSGDVPYQGATPAAAPYGSTNMAPQQQQYGYTSTGGPVQQQTYPSYSSAPPSDGYNNATQTPATGPAYQQQSVQPASSTHDQTGAQQAAAAGYGGQVAPTGGYSSYPTTQPAYGTAQTQNYGYNTSSQDPNYGYGAAPGSQAAYSQAAATQAGYEQQPATQPAGYAAAPGSAQVKTQSPLSAYAQYEASQVYAAPR